MKIMWHSAAPWEPSGYGTQTAIWTEWFQKQGHEVIISARTSLMYRVAEHQGMPVIPAAPFIGPGVADELLNWHVAAYRPDLLVILYDMWSFGLSPQRLPKVPIAAWMPIDCEPVDQTDRDFLASGRIYPVAMSEFGKRQIEAEGYPCGYVPHGIHSTKWNALPSVKNQIRDAFEVPQDAFVIGINATITDNERKALWEQMSAFAKFRKRHPNSVLMMHTLHGYAHAYNTAATAYELGLPDEAVRFPSDYRYMRGAISGDDMQNWYNCLDVLSNTSMGEGFGLPAIEAQACGIPVILGDWSTGPQLVGPGWLVDGQEHWNATHKAKWHVPYIDKGNRSILAKYEAAYKALSTPEGASRYRREAWKFAAQFDVEKIGPMWDDVLKAATGT